MKAFHNDSALKEQISAQLQAHYDADEIVKDVYWENGKGGAVGCTIHSTNHKDYKTELGIPAYLAWIEDDIFGGLPYHLAKEWPLRFIRAIPVGADLSKVWPKLAVFLLTDQEHGVLQYAQTDEQKEIIQDVADLYSAERKIYKKEWENASIGAKLIYLDAFRAIDDADCPIDNFFARAAYNACFTAYNAVNHEAHNNPKTSFTNLISGFFSYPKYYRALADKLIDLLSACK